jgi:hypothetical protein
MKTALILTIVVPAVSLAGEFSQPVMLKAGGEPVKVEAPGYACPSWADWDGDGKMDLLVGQFAKGKVHVFRNEGGDGIPVLAKGTMLLTGKTPAEVPGVW